MWRDAVGLFRDYMGTGMIFIWYMITLLYLWINERRKDLRILFVYMPLILLLVYFNPLFAGLVYRAAGGEVYYRILWLLPVTVTIAYGCVQISGRIARLQAPGGSFFHGKEGLLGDLFFLCMAGTIALSGSFIYSSPLFSKAENIYHVPESVVHICDEINVPGREVMAAFPMELVPYVRQYSPVTCMPYGREMTVERWGYYNPLAEAMKQEVIQLETLVPLIRQAGCHYCVFRENQKIQGIPEDYGWEKFHETDGYVIYRDPATELVIP